MRKQWKRTMRRIIACVLIVALVLPNTVVAAPKPEINKKSIILCKKEKYQLKISHQRKKPKWKTTNKKVVSVSKNGFIKGKKSGTATITGYAGGKKYKCKVTVADTKKSVYAGKTISLKSKSLKKYKKWNSSSTKIATVNKSGKVKTKKAGTVVITAKYKKKTYRFKLTVKKPEPATIYVDKYSNEAITTDKSDYVLSGTIKSKRKIKKVSANYNSDSNTKTKSLTINGTKKWKTKKIPLDIGYNYVTIAVSLTSGKSVKKKIQVNRTNKEVKFDKNVEAFNPENKDDLSSIEKIKSKIIDTIIDDKGTEDTTDDELMLAVQNDNPLLQKIKSNEIKKNDIIYIPPNEYFIDGLTQKYMYCDDNYTGDLDYNPEKYEVIHLKNADFDELFAEDVYMSTEGLNKNSKVSFVYTADQNEKNISTFSKKVRMQKKVDSLIQFDTQKKNIILGLKDLVIGDKSASGNQITFNGNMEFSNINPVSKIYTNKKSKKIIEYKTMTEFNQKTELKAEIGNNVDLKKFTKQANKKLLKNMTTTGNVLAGIDMNKSIVLAVVGIDLGTLTIVAGQPYTIGPSVFLAVILDLDGSIKVDISATCKQTSYHKIGMCVKKGKFTQKELSTEELKAAKKNDYFTSTKYASFAFFNIERLSRENGKDVSGEHQINIKAEGKAEFTIGLGVGVGIGVAGIVPAMLKLRLLDKIKCNGEVNFRLANYKLPGAPIEHPHIFLVDGRAKFTDTLSLNACFTARVRFKIGNYTIMDFAHDRDQKGKNVLVLLDEGLWAVTARGRVTENTGAKLSGVKVSFVEIKDDKNKVLNNKSTYTVDGEYTIGGFYHTNETYGFSDKKFGLMYEKEGYKTVVRELDNDFWINDNVPILTEMIGLKDDEISKISNPTIGSWDCIEFGRYWQNDTNKDGKVDENDEKEPIKWRVLKKGAISKEAIVMSDKILDVMPFNKEAKVGWETSLIRSYLNGYNASENADNTDFSREGHSFITNAFDKEDQKCLRYGLTGPKNDLIHIAALYFINKEEYGFNDHMSRQAEATKFAMEKEKGKYIWGCYLTGDSRERESDRYHIYVNENGDVVDYGCADPDTKKYGGVRVITTIDLKKANWTYAGKTN